MTNPASRRPARAAFARAPAQILSAAGIALLLLAAGGIRHADSLASSGSISSADSSSIAAIASPKRLIIPRLKIDAPLAGVGITAEGEMDVPANGKIPGWYRGGVPPGEPGNAVIAGHKDTAGNKPAIFANIGQLVPGDEVRVENLSGTMLRFRVMRIAEYDASHSPMTEIFGPNTKATLQLITCSGPWSFARGSYEKRLVVFTELMPS